MDIQFTKMHGAGNDYIYVWGPDLGVHGNMLPDLATKISDRHFGIGADGLVIIYPAGHDDRDYDFRMRIFNADGSEAQMCGNASRCIAKYLYENCITRAREIRLATLAGVKTLHLDVDNGKVLSVTVDMGEPILDAPRIPVTGAESNRVTVNVDDRSFDLTAVGMGNPHGVAFTDEITDHLVGNYGPLLEKASVWPEKANIEFVKVVSPDCIDMRVWERGSGETLACGTGSCAAVVACVLNGLTGRDVTVRLSGGELLIRWNEADNHLLMTGPAAFVASGIYHYNY